MCASAFHRPANGWVWDRRPAVGSSNACYDCRMPIHFMNCFTCNARFPDWKTGTLCLLVETDQGPLLVDTGLGRADYARPTWFTQFFRLITIMPFDPE